MPELPEVETTRQGIAKSLVGNIVTKIIIRFPRLRWEIPTEITQKLKGQTIAKIERRGKYLLFETAAGTLILHLGMSGHLKILAQQTNPQKHDHLDLLFKNGICLRFTDPRRFGCVLWTNNVQEHPLLKDLGPEPLTKTFSAHYLWECSRNRKIAIKTFIMNSKVVVGVGNIYANEALFLAGIHPQKATKALSYENCEQLTIAIKKVLRAAIKKGGTTLKDFSASDGKPGYFKQELNVYGRENLPCKQCKTPLIEQRLGQRSTVFCPRCQKL